MPYTKQYYLEHRDEILAKRKTYYKANRNTVLAREKANPHFHKTKEKFLDMYGRSCACCGEDTYEFLTLDHINGQAGKKRERSDVAYRRAVSRYNPKEFRTLCMNCNHATRLGSVCPHVYKS